MTFATSLPYVCIVRKKTSILERIQQELLTPRGLVHLAQNVLIIGLYEGPIRKEIWHIIK